MGKVLHLRTRWPPKSCLTERSPVAVIIAVEDYESLMETLEILSDPRAGAEIRQAEEEMVAGEVYDEADVRAALAARRR